ncbi:MAG TPA: efflux RND transporter periplasmic adaptor subunit [Lacunisphaera sp.]|jgi:membrane fusion protein (multidrug efflux system)
MFKKLTLTVIGLLVLLAGLAAVKFAPGFGQFSVMGAVMSHMIPPPEVVTATTVNAETWENLISATGSVVTVQGVTVSAEMAGKVVAIDFESGAPVKQGDLLVQLDTTNEEAQLRSAEANVAWVKANLARSTDLLQKTAISKSDFDLVDAQYKQSFAQADAIRAVIAKKTIRAPFAGRLGIRQVNLGQILKEGDPVASLQTLDPIYVNFSLPQQRLSSLKPGTPIRVTTDAAPGKSFEGKITAVNPDLDPVTRSVRVQATLANADEQLHPGMFANVDVVLPTKQDVLVIPATAVLYAPYGDSVYVVEKKKNEKTNQEETVLRQQLIRVGTTRGDFVTVVDGLKAGESVVTSGVFKLRPGEPVMVDNKLAPKAELNPKPDNT